VFCPLWDTLAASYADLLAGAAPGNRTDLTSFLQTVAAYRLYRKASTTFESLTPTCGE
jgi:hypothetical protein